MNNRKSGVRDSVQQSLNTEVPPLGNPDRKRALNVLAQRRYRQRRQNKIAELEAKVKKTPKTSTNAAAQGIYSPSPRLPPSTETSPETLLPTPDPSPPADQQQLNVDNDWDELISSDQSSGRLEPDNGILISGNETNVDIRNDMFSGINYDMGINPELITCTSGDQRPCLPRENIGDGTAFDANLYLQNSSDHPPPFNLSSFAFLDDSILEVPSLKVIKAAKSVTNKLGIGDELWDPAATWILDAAKFPFDLLPAHYRPTNVQLSVPHHPFIDALPWPSVRDKLICTFAQSPQLRPPSARDPMAVMYLALDIDDDAEGVRIRGPDELDEHSWEIGQTIFKNWWWAFSRSIIDNSNRLRSDRGAGKLRLQMA